MISFITLITVNQKFTVFLPKSNDYTKRSRRYTTSYSNIPLIEAETRIDVRISSLIEKVEDSLKMMRSIRSVPQRTLERVFERLVDTLEIEGFLEDGTRSFKEAVVHDFVGEVLRVVAVDYKRETNKKSITLTREKEVVSTDEETGGNMEFVLIDTVSVVGDRYLIVVKAKRDSLGKGLIQCLLSLKDMYDVNNDKKSVYGFIATGVDWQLIKDPPIMM